MAQTNTNVVKENKKLIIEFRSLTKLTAAGIQWSEAILGFKWGGRERNTYGTGEWEWGGEFPST